MPTKLLKPGSEVDSWCTKCRMDLLHRIIAMEGDKVVKVECLTCRGHHNYRRPKSAAAEPRSASPRASSSRSSSSVSPRKLAAAEVERQREASWEKTVAGRPITSFKAYRSSLSFASGDLIRHGKFGDGYIVRVIDRQKVEVMFKDGPRTLAQALEA
jgi:Zn ribbon nucleic-acid-binding protein